MSGGEEDLRPDQDVVRPGTSAALTARAIDATPPPPLVVAQEAVGSAVSAIPRLVDSIPSPLLGASLGFTLLFAVAASQRFRLRMAPLLMSGLLLLPVSNYHEAQEPAPVRQVQAAVAEPTESDEDFGRRERARRDEELQWEEWRDRNKRDDQDDDDLNQSSDDRSDERPVPRIGLIIPRGLVEQWQPVIEMAVPDDWSREDAERFLRRNSNRLRREIRRLREQHQLELRGRTYSTEYHHHSR